MQINGVGSNQVKDSYQRAGQMPNTTANKKETDEANKRLEALGVKVELSSQQKPAQEPVQAQTVKQETQAQEEPFSLIELLKTLWDEAKKLLRALWYSDESGADKAEADESGIRVREISSEPQGPEVEDGSVRVTSGGENVVTADTVSGEQKLDAAQKQEKEAQSSDALQARTNAGEQQMDTAQAAFHEEPQAELDSAEVTAASMGVAPPQIAQNVNEAISVEDAGKQQESFWEKLKVKFLEIFGQLMSDTPQMDSGVQTQTSFQSQEEQAQEEMPKKTKDGYELPEVEGRPLHTSHLQDSYNKYGQYSKLAQDPQSSMSIRK